MASIKLTGFMVSLILFSFFVGIFGLYLANLNSNYTPLEYDNSSVATFNKLDELQNDAFGYKNESFGITADKDSLLKNIDPTGGMFSKAVSAVQNILKSFDIFKSMTFLASSEISHYLGMDATVEYLKTTILSIVIILLIVGILIPIILRIQKEL